MNHHPELASTPVREPVDDAKTAIARWRSSPFNWTLQPDRRQTAEVMRDAVGEPRLHGFSYVKWIHRGCGVGPGEEAAVDDVGEVAFEGAAGFAWGLAFADLAGEEGLGVGVVALLDDRDAVERGVELAVAAAVKAVAAGGLAGAAGDRRGAAEACERGGVVEAANVAGLGDQRGGDLGAGAEQIGDRVAVLGQQRGDLGSSSAMRR